MAIWLAEKEEKLGTRTAERTVLLMETRKVEQMVILMETRLEIWRDNLMEGWRERWMARLKEKLLVDERVDESELEHSCLQ